MWVIFLCARRTCDLVVEHHEMSSLPYRKQSTAQHSAVNPHKQQNRYAAIRARQRKQADRVGWSPHVVQHLYCSLCSQNERRNRNLPPSPHVVEHIFSSLCSQNERRNRNCTIRWCDAPRVCLYTADALRPFHFIHECGVRVDFEDHGALGICESRV